MATQMKQFGQCDVSGSQLKAARALANLSRAGLARLAGVSVSTIGAIENGVTSVEGASSYFKLRQALDSMDIVLIERGKLAATEARACAQNDLVT